MPSDRVVEALNDQVAAELAAAHQYTAAAVYYDAHTFPRLAHFFYGQAAEEREHAMRIIKYLVDTGADVRFGDIGAPQDEFANHVAPIKLALDQERAVTRSFGEISRVAREEGDFVSEQFLQWFLHEQVEEEATMSGLLEVAERVRDFPMSLEEYVAREHPGEDGEESAPQAAGD